MKTIYILFNANSHDDKTVNSVWTDSANAMLRAAQISTGYKYNLRRSYKDDTKMTRIEYEDRNGHLALIIEEHELQTTA